MAIFIFSSSFKMGKLIGKQNIIYRYAIEGINEKMNIDIEEMFEDDYKYEHFINIIYGYAQQYRIK